VVDGAPLVGRLTPASLVSIVPSGPLGLGAVVGGLTVGVLLALVGSYLPAGQNLRLPFALVVIVAVLLVRPAGFLGQATVRRV